MVSRRFRPRIRGPQATDIVPGFVALVVLLALVLGACSSAAPVAPATADLATAEGCIQNEQGTDCLPVAPASTRVDLTVPSFTDPTRVDNPLHPSSLVQSAVYLGSSGGEPFRSEVTLLPTTRTIEWGGRQVRVLESQYFAYLDGRIHEVAIDWYAQADDGSVWYFGEDVFNYEEGALADTHGTWLAGRDGPAAMIMPADPRVGNVYRPENIPGLVFEEVSVQTTGVTVDGPTGPVPGAVVVRELHFDGTLEDKTFAPGYGEFSTGDAVDLEAMALAVPTDARTGPVPAQLNTLFETAIRLHDAASRDDLATDGATLAETNAAWEEFRSTDQPPMLRSQMDVALGAAEEAVVSQEPQSIRQTAIGLARAALDLQLQYRPPAEVDLARFHLFVRQLELDAAARDASSVRGDTTSLEWIADRFLHTIAPAEAQSITTLLDELRTATDLEDLEAATEIASHLSEVLTRIRPAS